MNIIYLGSFRLPNCDAAAARVINVARALRQAGNHVSFISWGGAIRPEDRCDDGIYRVDGFPYVVTNEIDFEGGVIGKAKGWLKQGNKTKKLLKSRLGEYDAIIAYNCSLISWLIPFCRKNRLYLVTDITEWYNYSELKFVERPGYFYNMHYVQKHINNKILISSYLCNYYQKSHNIIIPATCNATDAKWHEKSDNALALAGSFEGINLIYAGNPARKDAVHYTINAVQRLIDEGAKIRFIILGITRDNYLRKYANLLSKNQLSERIQFLGRVSQDEIPAFYRLADFMVLLRETTRKSNAGFPTKFSESFTSGTPVIANLTSDLDRYLVDGMTGFVVESPTEDAIYLTLRNRVMTLERKQIIDMKSNVRRVSHQLDYHFYIESLKHFFDNLVL